MSIQVRFTRTGHPVRPSHIRPPPCRLAAPRTHENRPHFLTLCPLPLGEGGRVRPAGEKSAGSLGAIYPNPAQPEPNREVGPILNCPQSCINTGRNPSRQKYPATKWQNPTPKVAIPAPVTCHGLLAAIDPPHNGHMHRQLQLVWRRHDGSTHDSVRSKSRRSGC